MPPRQLRSTIVALFSLLRRSTARTLVLLLLGVGWSMPLAFPHMADDDLLCALGAAGAGGEDERITRAAERVPDHCAICHSLRSLRGARLAATQITLAAASAGLALPATVAAHVGPTRFRLPARAPPA